MPNIILCILAFLLGAAALYAILYVRQSSHEKTVLDDKNQQLHQAYKEEEERFQAALRAHQETLQKKKEEDDAMLKSYYDEKKSLIDSQISSTFALEQQKMEEKIADFKQNKMVFLMNQIDEIDQKFTLKMEDWNKEKDFLSSQISELQSKRAAIIQAAKHEEEIKANADFYRLQLSDDDIQDYWELKKLEKRLTRKDVLDKFIYKIYFEKPYTDLVGRVVGAGRHTGIYKITNLNNSKVYIGQAVDLRERWKQHIKRGIGAEPATRNKLYPAMLEEGVWNFTFEVIEECDKDQLNEREQYYQNVFGAKEFGYSIK